MKRPEHQIFTQIPDLWHHIVETMDEALFLVDTNQDIIYFNRRAEQITGYTQDEVIGRHCLTGFRCPKCTTQCGLFEHERLTDVEVEVTHKKGTKVIALKNAVVLRDADGEIVGGLETFRDISALRDQMSKCSAARSHAEERGKTIEAVLGSIAEGIVALDPEHKVVSVSRRAREILGLDDEAEVIGAPCSTVLGSSLCLRGCPLNAPRAFADRVSHQRATLEIKEKRGGHTKTVHVTEGLSPLIDDEGHGLGHLLILTELPPEEADRAKGSDGFHGLIGRSPAMAEVFERVQQLSHSEVTVLISGESGTGKELAARAVHETSPRSMGPFLAVNCAALPEGLLESEIFGHVKGAFTGALRDRKGRVELADSGTLFLDEVGELPLPIQSKLLRLVQERTFERLGEERTRQADIRIIAATNRDLAHEVEQGRFREDLYYRLKVVPLRMPPLRDRGRDVALLAARLLKRQAHVVLRQGMYFTREAMDLLLRYPWPGNVRELVNMVEYVVALTQAEAVTPADLPPEITADQPEPSSIVRPGSAGDGVASNEHVTPKEPEDEAELVVQALERNGWHRINTAEDLGINRVTLYRLMRRYGITGPRGQRRSKLATKLRRRD